MTGVISIAKKVMNTMYAPLCRRDTEKRVLFMSRESDEPSVDYRLLAESISEKYPDYEIVMLCRMIGKGIKGKASYGLHILKQMKEMSRARVIVLDTYCIPVSILKHRSHQKIVQIWHSIGTMKKNSYSILDQPEGRSSKVAYAMDMHKNYDIILCAGEGYREYLAESFNYPPEELTIMPLPRVDLLRDKEYQARKAAEIRERYPDLRQGINIVYAPTFRMAEDERPDFEKAVEDLRGAVSAYGDKYNLIVKAHPLTEVESDCPEYGTMDMLAVCDVFISDYSCSIYEAGVMGIPLYFYTYDYESYMSRRSVYMDYPNEIPGAMHADAASLMEDIDSGTPDMDRQREFISKYIDLPDGSAADAIADMIMGE